MQDPIKNASSSICHVDQAITQSVTLGTKTNAATIHSPSHTPLRIHSSIQFVTQQAIMFYYSNCRSKIFALGVHTYALM